MKNFFIKALKFTAEVLIIVFITLILIKIADHYFGLYSRFLWIPREKENTTYRQPDPVLGHGLKPNAKGELITPEYKVRYEINSLGFRDNEYSVEKKKGVSRIFMIGDSFVEGCGVELEDTFTKVLENDLNKNKGKYEVINSGVVQYSPLTEYLLIKNKLMALKPDVIILVFFIYNDIYDDKGLAGCAEFDEKNLPVKINPPKSAAEVFEKQSKLYKFFYKEILVFNKIKNFLLRRGKKSKNPSTCYGDIIPEKNIVIGDNENWRDSWEATKHYLAGIQALLKQNNVKFVIVMMPAGHHVNGKEWPTGRVFADYLQGETYKNYLYDYMGEFCRQNNIYYCNLLPYYQKSGVFPIFYAGDGHLTVGGNKLTAEILYDYLTENGIAR